MNIAQMNWGRLRYPLEVKNMCEFSQSLDKICDLASDHPGFIWRIPDEDSASQLQILGFDELTSATISVWHTVESLKDYTYNSLHGYYLKRSKEWFEVFLGNQLVIWKVEDNGKPSFKDAFERLELLKNKGPSDYAYVWDY